MVTTILIVDDNPEVVFTVKEELEDLNSDFEVVGVDSEEKCLKLLKNNNTPDIIILDIMMPGMNGWDVAAEIKKNPK